MKDNLVLVDREALLAELRQSFDAQTSNTLLSVLDKVAAQVRAAGVTREDWSDMRQALDRLIEAHQRAELRLGRLEETVAALAEAQQRTEARVSELAEAQQRAEARLGRLEETVAALAEAQQRAEARLGRLEETVAALAEAQQRAEARLGRLEETVAALAEAQRRTEIRVGQLEDKVARIDGRTLEQEYREKAAAYFGCLVRRPRVVTRESLWELFETRLSADELAEVLLADLVVRGQPRLGADQAELWLVVEVSAVVDAGDVARARRRAELLRQAGCQAIPVAAGEEVTKGAEPEAHRQGVALLQDGRSLLWDEALAAWALQ